jgi:hypothetical protein
MRRVEPARTPVTPEPPVVVAVDARPLTPSADPATDLVVAALVALGTACWAGLCLGLLGSFAAAVALALGIGAGLVAWLARPTTGPRADGHRLLPALAVFVGGVLLYLPAYDTTLFGSDSTVYLNAGVHLARTGSLAVDDPLTEVTGLGRVDPFPPFGPSGPRLRSAAGLVFDRPGDPVWSSFSQLPSVWLALGDGLGGLPGALAVNPLLAAAALTSFFLLLRRLSGGAIAVLATGLLAMALPQWFFARFSMAEIGAQCFLWGALLAWDRWEETRTPVAALAAGVGLGLAAVARIEYVAFVPLALGVGWVLGRPYRVRPPLITGAVAMLLVVQGLALTLLVIPTHYRSAVRGLLALTPTTATAALAGTVVVACAAATLLVLRILSDRTLRGLIAAGLAAWGIAYAAGADSFERGGVPAAWLLAYTSPALLVLAGCGLPPLTRCWRHREAGRLALLLGLVVGAHFLLAAHAQPLAMWGSRRFLPVLIPMMAAAIATAVVALARWRRAAGVTVAAMALVLQVRPLLPHWSQSYFRGTSDAAAEVARLVPAGAVVAIAPGLQHVLLDVPLTLVHERSAVALRGAAGDLAALPIVARAMHDRPVYLVQHGLHPVPRLAELSVEPVGTTSFRTVVPGVGHPEHSDVTAELDTPLAVFRVRVDQGTAVDSRRTLR